MISASDLQFGAPNWSGLNFGAPAGASNPVGSYIQSAAANLNAPVGNVSGISGVGSVGAAAPAGGGGFGFNMDTGKLILGGLQTIGNLWQAWEANKLARDQFKFSKDFANQNMANSVASYNTQVDNIGRSRAFTEGQSVAEAAAWLKKNQLPMKTI